MRQISNEEDCIQHLTKMHVFLPIAAMIFSLHLMSFDILKIRCIKFHATCSFLPFR